MPVVLAHFPHCSCCSFTCAGFPGTELCNRASRLKLLSVLEPTGQGGCLRVASGSSKLVVEVGNIELILQLHRLRCPDK
eukprot:139478-Amphidinium_carterae.1